MRARIRAFLIDLIIAGTAATLVSVSFLAYQYAQRYQALTAAYIAQSKQLSVILNKQINGICPEPTEEPDEQQ